VRETEPNKEIDCRIVDVQDGSDCTQDEKKIGEGGKEFIDKPGSCKVIHGWSCNGAYQPARVQECLNKASQDEGK
jgi:hypothetical protein